MAPSDGGAGAPGAATAAAIAAIAAAAFVGLPVPLPLLRGLGSNSARIVSTTVLLLSAAALGVSKLAKRASPLRLEMVFLRRCPFFLVRCGSVDVAKLSLVLLVSSGDPIPMMVGDNAAAALAPAV